MRNAPKIRSATPRAGNGMSQISRHSPRMKDDWSVDGPIQDDGFEQNDAPSQASDLGTLTQILWLPGLVMGDTEDWYRSIPQEVRPEKDQPFYHLLAENAETEYVAYVSEQNLIPDSSDEPLRHPQVSELFEDLKNGVFRFRYVQEH